MIIELNKKYLIIYDDKGREVVKKQGIIISKENNLIKLDNGEILNMNQIIRAREIE